MWAASTGHVFIAAVLLFNAVYLVYLCRLTASSSSAEASSPSDSPGPRGMEQRWVVVEQSSEEY